MGIEPTYPAWKAGVLPLNYTRIYFILQKNSGISESLRAIDGARTRGLDLGKVARYQLRHYRIKRVMGIEPTYPAWKAGVLPLNYTRMFLYFFVSLKTRIIISHGFIKCNPFFQIFLIFFNFFNYI